MKLTKLTKLTRIELKYMCYEKRPINVKKIGLLQGHTYIYKLGG